MLKQEMFIHVITLYWLVTEIFASLFPNKTLPNKTLDNNSLSYLNDDFLLFVFRCFGSPDLHLD